MPTITINNGSKTIETKPGARLIDILSLQGIHLPSACGSKGKCGLCRIKVMNGGGPVTDEERVKITEQELVRGIRLACRIIPDSDIALELPVEYLNAQEYTCSLSSKRLLTSDIIELAFKLVSPPSMVFIPGQYILLRTPVYGDKRSVVRPFSLASSPSTSSSFQLNVRLNPEGICTPFLFNHLKEGDTIQVRGPRGNFFLRNTERTIIFIAGGSGMAPVRSILMNMRDFGIERKTWYFFGALTQKDLYYIDEMRLLEKELPDFKFVPALSNEPKESTWTGERGLITEVMDRLLTFNISESEVYLCGRPAMINSCMPILERKGIPADRAYYDLFTVAK